MLGGESEVSAMSEDISLPSLSITPSKKATTQSKQGRWKFIEFDAKTIFFFSKLNSSLIWIYLFHLADLTPSESRSVSGSSTPKTLAPVKTPGTGKKRGRPSKAVMREREEAKRARGELVEPKPKDKEPKRRGRKPKIDWASMSEEVSYEHRFTHWIYFCIITLRYISF